MPEKNNIDVLLSYGWVRSTYAALANFSRNGLSVAVADSQPWGMCQQSKYPVKFFKYADFLANRDQFLEDIINIIDKEKPQFYLPSHDETEIIAANRHLFLSTTQIPIADIKQLQIANDKSSSQEFASNNGVTVAQRFHYDSPEQLLQLIQNNQKTVIRLRKGNSAKGVFYATGPVHTLETVKSLIKDFNCKEDRYPVVQQYVNGDGYGVSCLYWKGNRIAHFTHRRLREKTETGGTSTLREHQPNQLLEQMAFKLLDNLKWHGLAMVEFKFDTIEKKGYFIEINPRLWGSIHLAISAGVEFPYLIYLCATQGPQAALNYQASCKIKYPWRSRWYLGDCILAVNRLRKLKFADAIKCALPGGTNVYDDFNASDPFAFLGEVLYYSTGFIRHRSFNPVQDGMIG